MKCLRHITILLPATLAATWPAQPACTNSDLKGNYGPSGTGNIVVPPNLPITGLFVRAGLISFDGDGTTTVSTVASYNGLIFQEPFKGTYTVQPDCTFTIKTTVPDPINLPATFTGLIADNGARADFFLVDPPGPPSLHR